MSRGGIFEYSWCTANPSKVSGIYADNPAMERPAFQRLRTLARADVPILQVCGALDPLLGAYASAIEAIYRQFGGRVSMMIKEGYAHHPHSLRNPKPIADFIEQSVQAVRVPAPAFVGDNFVRTAYYSVEGFYRDYPDEDTSITCRGPLFSPCYDRYEFSVPGTPTSTAVIVPSTAAAGMPWVYRAGFVFRDAKIDQELLARGFHIVTAPVTSNADGPLIKDWDVAYEYMIGHGFSKKPVIEGAGGGAGEMYAWAIENPDQVSCVYAENPRMRSALAKSQPLDNLAPLAKANVPLLHVCGTLDPWFKDNTLEVESDTNSSVAKSKSSSKRAWDILHSHQTIRRRLWTLSSAQPRNRDFSEPSPESQSNPKRRSEFCAPRLQARLQCRDVLPYRARGCANTPMPFRRVPYSR